eukprot:g16575.t1
MVHLRAEDDAGRRSVQQILEWCQEVTQQLASDTRASWSLKIGAKSDLEDETPGKKIRHWIGRGVPLLLTVQLAEGEQLANVRMTARDMPGVEATPAFVATPSVAAHETRRQLEEMHRRLQQGMAGDGAPEDEQELAGWEKLFSCIRPPPVYFWAKVQRRPALMMDTFAREDASV